MTYFQYSLQKNKSLKDKLENLRNLAPENYNIKQTSQQQNLNFFKASPHTAFKLRTKL